MTDTGQVFTVNEPNGFHGFESLSVLKAINLDTDEYRAVVRAAADVAGSSMADIAAAWPATQNALRAATTAGLLDDSAPARADA